MKKKMRNEMKSANQFGGKPKFFFRQRRTPMFYFGVIFIFTLVLLSLSTINYQLSTLHAALSCDSCHKGPPYGPVYVSSPTINKWNSHIAHTTAPFSYGCEICHIEVTTGAATASGYTIAFATNHVNSKIDLRPRSADYDFTYSTNYAVGQSSCTNIKCHGNNKAFWGGSVSCYDCHVSTTDRDDYIFNDGTIGNTSKISTHSVIGWFGTGHGLASGKYYSGRLAANFPAGSDGCKYCHDGDNYAHDYSTGPNFFRLANTTQTVYNAFGDAKNGVCLVCHSTVTVGGLGGYDPDSGGPLARIDAGLTKSTFTAHSGVKHGQEGTNTTDGGLFCWDCHDPHGDWNVTFSTPYARMFQSAVVELIAGTTQAGNAYGVPTTTQAITRFDFSTGTVTTAWEREDYVSSHTFSFACQSCHNGSVEWFSRSTWTPSATGAIRHSTTTASCTTCHLHKNNFEPVGGCINCHTVDQGNRRPIVPEFQLAWTHGRSSTQSLKVTDRDCSVCHMEGKSASDLTITAFHGDSAIDLRDPDTGAHILWSSWSAATNDHFTPGGASSFTFVRFETVYNSTGMLVGATTGYGTMYSTFTAVQINLCLKCHDTDGADSPLARVRSWDRPFDSTGTLAINSSGTVSALGNLFLQFSPTNASYHPVKGRGYNNYCSTNSMVPPWGVTGKATLVASTWNFVAGSLISCWDCHIQTATAHGGAATLRAAYDRPTTVETKLCVQCHRKTVYFGATLADMGGKTAFGTSTPDNKGHPNAGYYILSDRHVHTGDAIASGVGWAGCTGCHSSSYTDPGRRLRAENVHGFNKLQTGAATWTSGARPWGFFRNTAQYSNWLPKSGPGLPTGTGGTCYFPAADAACDPGGNHSASYIYLPGGKY